MSAPPAWPPGGFARLLGTLAARAARLSPRSLPLAGTVVGLALAGAAIAWLMLAEREGEAINRYRDSLVWAASQHEKELLRLELAIAAARAGGDLATVNERYDIAASRMDYLRVGSFATMHDPDGEIPAAIAGLAAAMDALGARLHRAGPRPAADELADWQARVGRMGRQAGALAVQANQAAAEARLLARRQALGVYGSLGLALLLLGGSVVVGAGLVLRQFATIDAARAQSEAMRRALEQALRAAEAGARAKATFLATMSHEIRTPMNGVLGAASLLQGTVLDQRQRGLLDILRSSGTTLLALIDDILDFSKLEAGRLQLRPRGLDPRALLAASAEVMAPLAQARQLDLVVELAPRVPARLLADELRLRQILLNLLSNAVKFTESGGVALRAGARRTGDGRHWLRISVEDTGIGIPAEEQPRLFNEFVQAEHGGGLRPPGTGLGLAICRRLAEAMGGRVRLDSQPGRGSRFRLLLPLPAAASSPSAAAASSPSAPAEGGAALVLGGAPPLRRALAALLAGLGHRVLAEGAPAAGALVLAHTGITDAVAGARVLRWGPGSALDAPLTAARLAAALRAAPAVPAAPAAPRGLAVLVAEDDPVNRDIAAELLRHLGQRPATVADGAAALRALQAQPFALLLLDLQMPGMDGAALARAVRALPGAAARLRIVALSAAISAAARRAAFAAGVDGFIAKPVTLELLAAALRAAAAPDAAPDAALDRERRALLRGTLGAARLERMMAAFWQSLPGTLARLAAGEAEATAAALHALRGAAANLGYPGIAAATRSAAPDTPTAALAAALTAALAEDGWALPDAVAQAAATAIAGLRAGRAAGLDAAA